MNDHKTDDCMPTFVGTTVIGERGQVVVPKELREQLHLETGTKLVIIQHQKGFMMLPADSMKDFLSNLVKNIESISG